MLLLSFGPAGFLALPFAIIVTLLSLLVHHIVTGE